MDAVLRQLLPYGVAAAIALAALWAVKQFLGETVKEAGVRFSAWLFRGPRVLGGRRLTAYRRNIARNYRLHPLGFLRDHSIEIESSWSPAGMLRRLALFAQDGRGGHLNAPAARLMRRSLSLDQTAARGSSIIATDRVREAS